MRALGLILCIAAMAMLKPEISNGQFISCERLEEHMSALNAAGWQGRKAGSAEGEAVAEYIASVFSQSGLKPFYAGSYIDQFTAEPLVGESRKTYRNVAGIVYGSNLELDGEYIVIGAHYDFAGSPDNTSNTVVDDNATGVAVMLEIANAVKDCSPGRNVIFVAFDAYEAGLLGSRTFVEESSVAADNVILMIDIARVGKLGEGDRLHGFSSGVTSRVNEHFMRPDRVNVGMQYEPYTYRADSESFTGAGIPTLLLTADAYPETTIIPEHGDMHDIASFIAETVCAISHDHMLNHQQERAKKKKKKGPLFEGGITGLAGTSFLRETDGGTRGKTLFSGGAGVYGQINMGNYFGLRPEVQYIHSGSRSAGPKIRMNSVVVPVSIIMQTPSYLAGSLQVSVGGYYRYTFSHTGFGAAADPYRNGAGVQWGLNLRMKRFGLGITSRYGVTDILRGDGNNQRERATYGTISYNF